MKLTKHLIDLVIAKDLTPSKKSSSPQAQADVCEGFGENNKEYQDWINRVRKKYPNAKLSGTELKAQMVDWTSINNKVCGEWDGQKGTVLEAGPFSYGAKQPRKGSLAASISASNKKEYAKMGNFAFKNDMVGTAKVINKECPKCHSGDIKTYSDGEKECHTCHATWDVKGMTETKDGAALPKNKMAEQNELSRMLKHVTDKRDFSNPTSATNKHAIAGAKAFTRGAQAAFDGEKFKNDKTLMRKLIAKAKKTSSQAKRRATKFVKDREDEHNSKAIAKKHAEKHTPSAYVSFSQGKKSTRGTGNSFARQVGGSGEFTDVGAEDNGPGEICECTALTQFGNLPASAASAIVDLKKADILAERMFNKPLFLSLSPSQMTDVIARDPSVLSERAADPVEEYRLRALTAIQKFSDMLHHIAEEELIACKVRDVKPVGPVNDKSKFNLSSLVEVAFIADCQDVPREKGLQADLSCKLQQRLMQHPLPGIGVVTARVFHQDADGFELGESAAHRINATNTEYSTSSKRRDTFFENRGSKMINEAFKLKDKVKIVSGPKDAVGKTGFIGEIRKDIQGRKTYTIDYEVEGRDRPTSIQLTAKDIRMVKESKTFKAFIVENRVKSAIERIARELLGGDTLSYLEMDEKVINRAREIAHKFVDSGAGPWVIQSFKDGALEFVRAIPPKSDKEEPALFFVPKQTTSD